MRPVLAALAIAALFWTTGPTLAQQAGERFRDCPECPEMAVLPPGSFIMGSPAWEGAHREHETPARRIGIDRRLAVGAYEVTFAEWDACVAGGGCGGYSPAAPWGRGRQPVVSVSWFDARSYADWLARRTGRDYRLLTEAEWEYVARAGTTTPFHTGATIATDQANYDGLSTPYGAGVRGIYRARTTEAGAFAPNAFGLYDVHGNAAELVQDCYEDATGGATCNGRVVRGGSWANGPELLRSAYRGWCAPTLRNHLNGFRVARNTP